MREEQGLEMDGKLTPVGVRAIEAGSPPLFALLLSLGMMAATRVLGGSSAR